MEHHNDIRNVAFEPIKGAPGFSRGMFIGINVIIHMKTGYVNGSALVGQVNTKRGNSKRFGNWMSKNIYKELVAVIAIAEQCTVESLTYVVDEGINEIRGTYIHQDVVPHAAQWASPEFAHKVSKILKKYAIEEAVVEKNIEIKSLHTKIDDQTAKINELLGYAKNTLDNNVVLNENIKVLQTDVKNLNDKIELYTKRYVPVDTSNTAQILIVAKHKELNKYALRRGQKRSHKERIRKLEAQGYNVIVYEACDANPVDTAKRIVEHLPDEVGDKIDGEYLCIQSDNHDALMRHIESLEAERRI